MNFSIPSATDYEGIIIFSGGTDHVCENGVDPSTVNKFILSKNAGKYIETEQLDDHVYYYIVWGDSRVFQGLATRYGADSRRQPVRFD